MRFGFDLQRLTDDELATFLVAARADDPRFWLAFLLGFWHALRVTEVLNLTRADVEGGFISVRRLKGSEPTIQPLMEHTNPLFNEKAAMPVYVRNLAEEQKLFPFSRFVADRRFKKYGAAAGLPAHKQHCHVLKHTSLAKMIGPAGVPATQAWAGHKSGASTLIYTKVDPDEAARAARSALSTGI